MGKDKDFAALNQEILVETDKLAKSYAAEFADDPEGELRAWLLIAARREAMVSEVYGAAGRSYRLPEPRVPAAEVAMEALTLIWQQEVVHTRFVEVRLIDGVLEQGTLSKERMLWLGKMEGAFLAALTRRPGLVQTVARLGVYLGALFTPGLVPPFTVELGAMDPRDFFLLCSALETTARQSYTRMGDLARVLARRRAHDGVRRLQIENLTHELVLKTADETFHEQAFQEMATWVSEGRLDGSLDERTCADRLAALLPRSGRALGDSHSPYVLTDGGLGPLFKNRGVDIRVS